MSDVFDMSDALEVSDASGVSDVSDVSAHTCLMCLMIDLMIVSDD